MRKQCVIEGCSKPVVARGWCRKHYNRWHSTGTTDQAKRRYARGQASPFWKAGDITVSSGRSRAQKAFVLGSCKSCGAKATDRHHIDGDTSNNSAENIMKLCRRCHMRIDGRGKKMAEWSLINNQPQPPKPCSSCGTDYKPLRRGMCSKCYEKLRSARRKNESNKRSSSGVI